ncbi:HNH endonuclease [Photobacterium damselae]|uniref:HNH endonuclease n=1 Tax=Photobacterium damselae TaxID=38293 RepID=UPI00370B75BC
MALEFKYMTKSILMEANEAAIREGRENYIYRELIVALPDSYKAVVMWDAMLHPDERVLCLYITEELSSLLLSVSELRYETLPLGVKHDNGCYQFEKAEYTEKKRPYPNGREWIESVIKRPLRKQASFREKILNIYGSCCAVCDISEKSLLRAAHIIDVAKGGSDNVNNGICLCVNHEVAFDKGLLIIHEDYSISSKFDIGIKSLKIRLPIARNMYPLSSNLKQKKNEFRMLI